MSFHKTSHPIHVGIKYPDRMSAEYDVAEDATRLCFHGGDGSCLMVLLSRSQALALTGLQPNDPAALARDLYVQGHIEVDELERRL